MDEKKNPKRIRQTTVVKEILDRIQGMLLRKELNPGDRLPSEQMMAEQFGVGKSSIREAVKMLDAVGVVESRQGSGTMICQYPKEDSLNPLIFQMILLQGSERELLEFRRVYETAYTFMAMDAMAQEDLNKIKSRLVPHNDAKSDMKFHHAVLESTHNPYIIRTGEVLLDLCESTLVRKFKTAGQGEGVNVGHKRIYAAFLKKDKKGLKEALDESFDFYGEYFIEKNRKSL